MANSTLPFWWLLGLVLLILIAGRLISGLIMKLARQLGRTIHGPATRPPQANTWITARWATGRFSGLPLTLSTALALCLAAAGIYLAHGVLAAGPVVHLDQQINAALAPLRNPELLRLLADLSYLGDKITVIAILIVATAFLWATRRRLYIPGLLLTVLGAEALTYVAKYAIDRPRPDFLTFASATSPSFPSSHATGAMALYGFLAYVIARSMHRTALRFEVIYWASALIALIAASRLLLSVHFTSDVAAGLLVGGLWLLIGLSLTEYLHEHPARR